MSLLTRTGDWIVRLHGWRRLVFGLAAGAVSACAFAPLQFSPAMLLGCTVGLPIGTQITCPCHGSQYSLTGANLLGPAVSPLVHFSVTEATPGGMLVVNTAQTVAASVRLT